MKPSSSPVQAFQQATAPQPGSKRYSRLEKRVIKVWPYAAYAGLAMDSLETELQGIPSAKERKAVIQAREDALKVAVSKESCGD